MSKNWTKVEYLEAFVKGALGKKKIWGNFNIQQAGDTLELIYTAQGAKGGMEKIAIKLSNGETLYNANRLSLCESYMAWGRRYPSCRRQTQTQERLDKAGARGVPFRVFDQIKANINNVRIIDKGESEEVGVKVQKEYDSIKGAYNFGIENRHYIGACLLETNGVYFLFDIDREEILHGGFNPFMVKLPKPATTISEAYNILEPETVKQAKAEGLPVERQGEWYFIKRLDTLPPQDPISAEMLATAKNAPHVSEFGGIPKFGYRAGGEYGLSDSFPTSPENKEEYLRAVEVWGKANDAISSNNPQRGSLRNGQNRPNNVEMLIVSGEKTYVSGKIVHSGREHRDLHLVGWWEPIPNTAVESWQITGDID